LRWEKGAAMVAWAWQREAGNDGGRVAVVEGRRKGKAVSKIYSFVNGKLKAVRALTGKRGPALWWRTGPGRRAWARSLIGLAVRSPPSPCLQ
jgi:hypothetical protein